MANRAGSGAAVVEEEDEAQAVRKGPWTVEEDMQLMGYIRLHGEGRWNFLAKAAGLNRTGRSCRLRWLNSLRPDLKRSKISPEEERLIIELHGRWGNRWSYIARSIPGRTDNEIKNYWRTRIRGKLNRKIESGGGGGGGMDVNRIHSERLTGSYYLPTSSQRLPDHDRAEPLASLPMQSTEEVEIGHVPSQTNDDGQPDAVSYQDLEGSKNQMFEKSLPYNFLAGSPASLLYSSDFCTDTASPSYMVASPGAFSDSEAYLSRYSDVLWNLDEVDDRFNGSKQSASRNDRR